MELDQLYESIQNLKAKGAVANTYGGTDDPYDPDGDVLSAFMEYINVWHAQNRPDWLEAFYQVLAWQFETFHEGADGYYENFYGDSPRAIQVKTADFLEKNGYQEIAAQYRQGLEVTVEGVFGGAVCAFGDWMDEHLETVWRFCLDILEKHRSDWPEPEERNENG